MAQGFAPKGIGAVLDGAIDLYRRGWRPLAAAALIVVGPAALVVSIAQVFYMRGYLEFLPLLTSGGEAAFDPAVLQRLALPSALSSTVSPLYWLATMYVAACVYAAAPALQAGERMSLRDFFRGGRARYLHLLGVTVLVLVAVEAVYLGGVLLGFVPLVLLVALSPWTLVATVPLMIALLLAAPYVGARLALSSPVTVLEGAGVVDSLRRSWRLTDHRWLRVVAFFVCFGMINFAIQGALNSPAAVRQLVDSIQDPQAVFRELSWGWKVFEGLLSASSVSLGLPFAHLAWYVFYIDTRSRAEGLDLLVRAREIEAERGPEAA